MLYNQIPYPLRGRPTYWRIIIMQRFSHRSESLGPHRLPRALAPGRQAPRAFGFEGQQGLTAGTPQDWGK